MVTKLREATKKINNMEQLRTKAALFDEMIGLIEDKYLAYLMKSTETEPSIPLSQAKKMLR